MEYRDIVDVIPGLALFTTGDGDFYLPAAFIERYGERFADLP